MSFSADYQRLVLDDLKTYAGIYRPVKSSLLRRICTRKLPTASLHPNPDDEFCDPAIGPNDGIISKYMSTFSFHIKKHERPVEEKLTVGRISTGGYMLLNGHHRWMAASKLNIQRLPVTLVNFITDSEIISTISSSERKMCASFDLDEVLFTDSKGPLADHRLPFPYQFLLKRTLRRHAGLLITELQAMGFDVWVYSGGTIPQEEIDRVLSLHKAHVDGMVMLIKGKKSSATLKKAFSDKYELSLHIDGQSLLWVNTRTRAYESIPVSGGAAWASDVLAKVRELNERKRICGEQSHA